MLLKRYAAPGEIARFVEAATEANTLGRITREQTTAGRRYAVTCGGCAFREELDGTRQAEAHMDSRERGWRDRSIPGLSRSRHFCPACLRDMDLAMRFAFVTAEATRRDPQELADRTVARWAAGNPYALPLGYARSADEG